MVTLEDIPLETQKRIFKRLEDIADIDRIKRENPEKYEGLRRAVDNYNLGMYSAWVEGYEEGLEHVRIESVARKLLRKRIPVSQIMEITNLTLEQVNELKEGKKVTWYKDPKQVCK